MMAKPRIINSLDEIVTECQAHHGQGEFFILLNGGLRSSKDITYDGLDKKGRHIFEIFHSIDGSIQRLRGDKLLNETNIGEAIRKNAFFAY
jgi:hypothetical protein